MKQIEFYAEAYRQLAFVSAVLGGFSVAFLGVILVARDERRIAGWTIGLSIAASSAFIVATFLDSFLVFTLQGIAARAPGELPGRIVTVAGWSVVAFYVGVFSLLGSLGLAGWLRSWALGIISTILASTAGLVVLLAAYQLGRALNG